MESDGNQTQVTLERIGLMPMPLDIKVTYTDGSTQMFYVPLTRMYWHKPNAGIVKDGWAWSYPTYNLTLDTQKTEISKIQLDPSLRMADVDRENNVYEQ